MDSFVHEKSYQPFAFRTHTSVDGTDAADAGFAAHAAASRAILFK